MNLLLRMSLTCLLLLAAPLALASEDETVDPMPEEGLAEISPSELSQAINEVSKSTPATPAKPVAENDTARSLRHGMRQADVRAAIDAHDAAAVERALERLAGAGGEGEPGPMVQRRKARLMSLIKEEKWNRAQSLVSTMIRDRRRYYQTQHGADQATMVVLGAWLRFAQLGGTARCSGNSERTGALVKAAMSSKLNERLGKLEAGIKADPLAQRALEAQTKIAPLAGGGSVSKATGCQVKELASGALAGL